ncbi:MAG: hypothetical protein RIF33_06575 [Cyclobacteriaceae bacterium]
MNETQIKTEKGLVKKLRELRDRMNVDMQDMSYQEMKEYLRAMQEKKSPQQST